MSNKVLKKSITDTQDISVENIAGNIAEKPEKQKKVKVKENPAKKKYKTVVTVGIIIIVLAIAATLTIFLFNNQNAEIQELDEQITSSEPKPVPATDESIKFDKERYNIKIGKSVKATYKYTPPTKDIKTPTPYVTLSSNNINIATVDDKGNITGVSVGTTSIVAVADTGVYTTVPVTVTAPESHTIDDVPLLYQGDDYPSGCESVSSTMLLQYYGYKIDVDDFIDDYLITDYFEFDEDGQMIGPDTYSAFIGSPYSEDSLGCFPPVIEKAMNKYLKSRNHRAVDVTGASMDFLLDNYIASDQPVLIWATMWMMEPFVTYEWTVKGATNNSPYNDGDTCRWLANEHCMVLVGYDKDNYYLNDPLSQSTMTYDRETFDMRYAQMGKCALVLEEIIE